MNKVLIIYGPTATGKTSLAINLADKFNGELISADSRQVYKGLDIGSGKVSYSSKVERHKGYWNVDGIKIHGFDLVSPGQRFSVFDFLNFTNTTMIQIIGVKKIPIIVGGTGFYIKALIDGIETVGIPANQKLRDQLEKLSTDQLYQKLRKLDPKRTKMMNESDRQNPRRLIRAIEIALSTSSSVSHTGVATTTISALSSVESRSYRSVPLRSRMTNYLLFGLTASNSYLYSRVDTWLEERLSHGMIGEIRSLADQKVDSQWLDDLGLEYRWISRYISGKVSWQEAIDRLWGDIHSFIRRQKTWFKKFEEIYLYDISKPNWQKELEKKLDLLLFYDSKKYQIA
ncbi:tRNA (adenosine(37)-N6)-dimethylallyltransferase MiaA [Candidatus Curtissbacteria bacterium RBG_13_35_7]|uniref:tRNA dimethylallyltransferase n=1 Tax=Candidatus Curtissbacteria bacterium RBG_13_35_7 TaxID=1797705 RepID=A0A1F5G163_9BACT|nr:MAG: tRNA (adenosine(37)-N6)-dimethylallyltransferase MiaA [Candidatus Curtissbacteria bacterium RBG_13_35_7]